MWTATVQGIVGAGGPGQTWKITVYALCARMAG
jgi:hypothetical protein